MTYSDKLKDPRWQKKRLEVMDRDEFKCTRCGSRDKTLNVHHTLYFKGRDPWDYDTIFLKTLCQNCHYGEHNVKEIAKQRAWAGLIDRPEKTDLQCQILHLESMLLKPRWKNFDVEILTKIVELKQLEYGRR